MKRRPGFTITELLVSMALIMLIMGVMAEAFTESLKAFAAMKAIGDMDQKMRAAIVILARDLSDDHFGTPYTRLSNISGSTPITNPASNALAPSCGFFAIFQPALSTTPPNFEGNDADGNPSFVNTSGLLHFTVNRAKSWDNNVNIHYGRRENYLSGFALQTGAGATVAGLSRFQDGQNYYSQVAEVAYFLRDSGDTTPSGAKRFTLFRRQAVVLRDSDAIAQAATSANASNFCDFSWSPTTHKFNSFGDLTVIGNRRLLPGGNYGANAPGCAGPIPIYAEDNATFSGNDILLTDVLSFDIQVMRSDVTPFTFQDVTSYDTSTAQTFNIKAIQIIIRVWDLKTQSTRQITIVQDM